MEQKLNSNSSAGTAADSSTQPIVIPSADIAVNPMLGAVVTWWKARMLNYPFWRVEYKDGKRTRLLYYPEAKGLADVFNGRLHIDYNCR